MRVSVVIALLLATLMVGPVESIAGDNVKYRITKETVNDRFSKDTLEIEINHKTSKENIAKIANSLRATRKQYDRLWIFYYLPKMKHGSGAWATSHFTPRLEVQILGSTEEEDKKLNAATVHGKKILGKWRDNRPMAEMTLILFKEAGKPVMKLVFKDGSSMEEKLKASKAHGLIKYQSIEDIHGEYYILEKNGNLGLYGPNGKFSEAKRVK